jgi:tRNA nucleotidyltransferase/poly(A) polymerase
MADYIYLLENRLSADQQHALRQMREAAREAGTILFLTGDAVRDLTSGHAVHDLEVSVHGNALKLKKIIGKLGGKVWGENEASRSLYLCFPGTVRVDVNSTHRTEYPTPGKQVIHSASIQEDLRRRDFTVNAMAISLNEGSFGLLMDPLNGAADIEARSLRLVSNYGFLEQPALLIRATRYIARLGWELDPKTLTRYENAKGEGVIEHLSAEARSQELEQIGHEEEGLKVLRALEQEGWMKYLFPTWTVAKANEEKLIALHALAVELLLQGVHPDMSAAQMQLLTAHMSAKDLTSLKKLMLRPGFVAEWNSLDSLAAGFAKVLLAKANAAASASYKVFTIYDPEAILWLGFTSKDTAVRDKFEQFLKVWPEARQRIPHALLQEMRITPELAGYSDIVHAVFLELIDGRQTTPEEMRAFLEPHSPPAPPPQVTIKRPRIKRGEPKVKEHAFEDDEDAENIADEDDDLGIGGDDEGIDLGLNLPKLDIDSEMAEEPDSEEDELLAEESDAIPAGMKRALKIPVPSKQAKEPPVPAAEKGGGSAAKGPAAKPKLGVKAAPAPSAKTAPIASKHQPSSAKGKAAPSPKPAVRPAVKKATPAAVAAKGGKATKPKSPAAGKVVAKVPSKAGKAKTPVKAPVKTPVKAPVKAPAKAPIKVPVKKVPIKASAKKPVKVYPAKSAPAKGKLAHSAAQKAGKGSQQAKPRKPEPKKPAHKAAKKR